MCKILLYGLIFYITSKAIGTELVCGNRCFGERDSPRTSCHCDIACSTVYNDCCSDSKHLRSKTFSNTLHLICKKNVLVVNSCPRDWKGPDFVGNLCKLDKDYDEDPVSSSLVTSEVTGVTYNNYYCAVCNKDTKKLITWDTKITCFFRYPRRKKYKLFNRVFYRKSTKEWGYMRDNNVTNVPSFQVCAVTSKIPEAHSSKIRHCRTKGIDTCVSDWENEIVREKCLSYTDPVYSNGTKYKNFYCAVCNKIDESSLSCGDGITTRDEARGNQKMSFALLIDINLSKGNKVGKTLHVSTCHQGYVYDPYAQRCRKIFYDIPGIVLQKRI